MGEDARWSAEQLEADFDALLDLGEAARAQALADIERADPGRAQALRRWLGAVSASTGLLEDVGAAAAPGSWLGALPPPWSATDKGRRDWRGAVS